jgi:hypothetical protein
VGRGLDPGGFEGGHACDVLQYGFELAREQVGLVVGERQASQAGHVQHVVTGDVAAHR